MAESLAVEFERLLTALTAEPPGELFLESGRRLIQVADAVSLLDEFGRYFSWLTQLASASAEFFPALTHAESATTSRRSFS